MHRYEATYRLDEYEEFCTDTQSFVLYTCDFVEAAVIVTQKLGPNVTLIELKRIV